MMHLSKAELTVPEAAFVTGHTVRSVNHEIDGGVIVSQQTPTGRLVRGADLLYLAAVRNLRTDLGPRLRRRLREAIADAARTRRAAAAVEHLSIALDAVETEVAGPLRVLERLRADEIESRPDVLAGEPVLKGTRIPARLVADLLRQGATAAEIADAYEITPEQIASAALFDRVSPRQGRPPRRRLDVSAHR